MRTLFLLLIFSVLLNQNLRAGDWQVEKNLENNVTFHSSTTMLDFEGTTNNVDGYIYLEGDSLFGKNNEIYFEVTLATFVTGLGKRDRDMRKDVLHTDKYPLAVFKGSVINFRKETETYKVNVNGTMSLHGVSNNLTIPGEITFTQGIMNVTSDFGILLKDHNIEAPSLMAFIKVAEEIKINVNLSLTDKSKE